MNSKERVLMAVNHQEPDMVPVDYWATPEITERLQQYYGIHEYEELMKELGVDCRYIQGPSYVGLKMRTYPDHTEEDLWGVRRVTVSGSRGVFKWSYKEVAISPLEKAETVQEIEAYIKERWPSADWWDYSNVEAECDRHAGYCVIYAGDRLDRTAQLKPAMYLRGIQQILMDMVINPAIAHCLFDAIAQYFFEYIRRVFQASKGKIDIFMMGDDMGTQNGPMISVDMWRKFFKANFRRFIDIAHQFGIKVMYHTCGSVRALIPEFIDCGLDILQSLQPKARGMDLAELKKEYGKYLAFHGGLDIQETLPFGTVDDVRQMVKCAMEAGKPGGGYIICTAHNIQPDTPTRNVVALFEACKEFRKY